jgi:hypothetical protein
LEIKNRINKYKGATCTKDRYGENLCHEDLEEGRNVEEGSGVLGMIAVVN